MYYILVLVLRAKKQNEFRTSQDRNYVDTRFAHEVKGPEPNDGGGYVNGNEDVPIILKHLLEFCHDSSLLLLKVRRGLSSNVLKD